MKSTMKFAWQFGDSTKASTKDMNITHIYDSVGTFTVQASILDTSTGQTLAKQSGTIKILPLNAPTLTLTVPDTNFWGDSCVMIVSSSHSLEPGWKFYWSLGDSTTISGTDSVLHYYLTPGTYTVTVMLNDTVHHITLASKTGTVHVVARHFNLGLLQTMKYVDIIIHTTHSESNSSYGYPCQPPNIAWYDSIIPLSIDSSIAWNQLGFGQTEYWEDTGFQSIHTYQNSLSANTDTVLTQVNFTESIYSLIGYQSGGPGSSFCRQVELDNVSLLHIPFLFESDTDIEFKLTGHFPSSCNITSKMTIASIGINDTIVDKAMWNLSSYVIIRFHN